MVAADNPQVIDERTSQSSNRKVIPGHISALDGLRAFAIIAVIFHHCGEYYLLPIHPARHCCATLWKVLGWEWTGCSSPKFTTVEDFYHRNYCWMRKNLCVIMGALIGSLLNSSRHRTIGKAIFFQKILLATRAANLATLLFVLAGVLLVHRQMFSRIGVAPFALYYRNFLGPDHASDIYIGQFWSLCVEEQFYLVWPVVLFFLTKRWRLPLIML